MVVVTTTTAIAFTDKITWFGVKLAGTIVSLTYVIFRNLLWALLVATPSLIISSWMLAIMRTFDGLGGGGF